MVSVLEIVRWTRSQSVDAGTPLLLYARRDLLFVGYTKSGETCCDYNYRIDIDLVNKTVTETLLWDPTDGTFRAGLKILGKNLATRHLGGYGTIDEPCGAAKGVFVDFEDTSKYICFDDNFTGNVHVSLYDPVSHKIIAGTGAGGNKIHVIDPDTFTRVGYVLHSKVSERGNVVPIPRDDEKVFIIYGLNSITGTKLLGIGLVDIQDIIDNAPDHPNVDELGSWQQLYETTSYYTKTRTNPYSNGSKVLLHGNDGTSNKALLYDPVNNTLTELDTNVYRRPLQYQKWLTVDISNQQFIIYDDDGITQVTTISDSDISNKVNLGLWFALLTNTSTQEVILKGLSPDGNVIPWIEWDFTNNKFRVIDLLTGNPISIDVWLMWSRLQYGISEESGFPYIANGRISTMTVNDWTPIPTPPTSNVRVLYVIPKFI